MNRRTLLMLIMGLSLNAFSQVAGKQTYAFLNMPASSRHVALGSNLISVLDNDLSVAWNNPAALNPSMHNHVMASYNNYIKDINSGYFSYSRTYDKIGSFSAGVMYIDYGKFAGFSNAGISTGEFTVQDQCLHFSYGKQWKEKIRLGASLKYIYSIYESYVSSGVSSDMSGMYHDTSNGLTISAFARNIGYQVIPYSETERQNLPFELAVTISKRLEHLPFRYYLMIKNLQKLDMRYVIQETGSQDEKGDPRVQEMTMGDNILRHFGIGGELNLSKHFVLQFGYNHQRRKEMTQDQKRGTSGFSWGLGFRVSKFNLSYGSSAFFPGYNTNQFSVLMNLSEFYKKNN